MVFDSTPAVTDFSHSQPRHEPLAAFRRQGANGTRSRRCDRHRHPRLRVAATLLVHLFRRGSGRTRPHAPQKALHIWAGRMSTAPQHTPQLQPPHAVCKRPALSRRLRGAARSILRGRRPSSRSFFDFEQLHVEGQPCVRRYRRRSPLFAVGQVCRHDKPPFASHLHCRQPLIPAWNHVG